MAGSGWFIDNIELPIAPDSDERLITRSFQSETLFQFFPQITKSSARAFDYTISGIIFPEVKAFALDQIAKSADTNTVVLKIPVNDRVFESTQYAVKSLRFARKGPSFIDFSPDDLPPFALTRVYPYTITFTELPDEGETQNGLDAFTDSDEDILGQQFQNELNEALEDGSTVSDTFDVRQLWGFITGATLLQ